MCSPNAPLLSGVYGPIDPPATFKYYAKLMRKVATNSGGFSLEDHQRFKFDIEKSWVPDVVLKGDSLIFSRPGGREVMLPMTLLEDFTDLGESDSESIYGFAKRWGRLKFKAIWSGAMALHCGEHGDQKDWAVVLPDAGWPEDFWLGLNKENWGPKGYWNSKQLFVEWGLLLDLINTYIDLGGVRLRFTWDPKNDPSQIVPRLSFGCPNAGALFGTLAIQLMFAVSNTEGAAICTSCGLPYFPRRRPKAGQRRFCHRPKCGRQAANRHAARDFRQTHPGYRQQFD